MAGENAPGGRDLANTDKNNFGPRIGFAYSGFKSDKTLVLRGGYGLLYAVDISAAQPLTSNPGTGAGSYACTPITNPGRLSGCSSWLAILLIAVCRRRPLPWQRRARVSRRRQAAVSSSSTIRIARMRCITSTT